MELSWFLDDARSRRVMLDFGGGDVLSDYDLLQTPIKYEELLNPGEDFQIGTAAAASMTFETGTWGGTLFPMAGREFDYLAGIQKEVSRFPDLAKKTGSLSVCRYGDLVFSGYDTQPFLRAWRDGEEIEVPALPALPVKAVLVINGILYAVHEQAPWITAYSLPGLGAVSRPALSAYHQKKLEFFAKNRICFSWDGTFLNQYRVETFDMKPVDLVETLLEFGKVGKFRAMEPEKIDGNALKAVCYDRMSYFDADVSDWFNQLRFPIKAKDLLSSLCRKIGVPLLVKTFLNENYLISENAKGEGITGRAVLQWIAQMAACFVRMNPVGQVELGWYSPKNYTLTMHDTFSSELAEYQTQQVESLQIRVTQNDVGVKVPPDFARTDYVIENNPLIYAESDGELRPLAESVLNAIRTFRYTPYTAEVVSNPFIHTGDMITLNTASGNIQAVIMEKEMEGFGERVAAAGNETREALPDAVNISIQRLRGKTNELTRTIDETRLEMEDADQALSSQIVATAKEIRAEVKSGDEALSSQIVATAKEIRTEVKSVNDNLSSEIEQNSREIALRVKADGIIAAINISKEKIVIDASKVDLKGLVTFTDLSTPGKTTISGDNIKTGTLDADLVTVKNLEASAFRGNTIEGATIKGSTVISDGSYGGYVELSNGQIYMNDTEFYTTSRDTLVIAPLNGLIVDVANGESFAVIGNSGHCRMYYNASVGGDLQVEGDLTVQGEKNCVVSTRFGDVRLNAYETPGYYLGDIGEARVSGGVCVVPIDPILLECVNTETPYQVFLTPYGPGELYVSARDPGSFTVCGDDISFGWEIKAKRRGYEYNRFKPYRDRAVQDNALEKQERREENAVPS